MKTTMLIITLTAVFASISAEPPSGRQYLPPGRFHQGAPFAAGPTRLIGAPSTQYGAPALIPNRFGVHSSQYGAPAFGSNRFGVPSSQYGAPAFGSNRFDVPSSQYGAPAFGSNRFGTPLGQYGAPSINLNRFSAPLGQYAAPLSQYNGAYTGSRYGYNGQDPLAEPASYGFSYKVQDGVSGNDFGHQENRQGADTRGSYHVLLPDGRTQIVDYVANEAGYTPTIRYEETHGGYPAATATSLAGPY